LCVLIKIGLSLGRDLRLNDFTNLRDDELSLLIKFKYDKYIEYCKHADGKIPDVEFQKNGETWVLDVRFTKPHNEEESFASKTDKY